jgi:transcriptional regulator with XRE-family HTH domain
MLKSTHLAAAASLPSISNLLVGRLRDWREQHDIPIKRAAADLGVSPATWDHWEKGRRFPTMDDFNLLAQYLRLPPCLLLCPFQRGQCGYCTKQK